MKINNLTIVPPEGMEAYQEGDEIKFRPVEEKLTYEDIAKKLLAINKLMNVAKYLNNGWKPDWSDSNEVKYHLVVIKEEIMINYLYSISTYNIYFRTKDLAKRAI